MGDRARAVTSADAPNARAGRLWALKVSLCFGSEVAGKKLLAKTSQHSCPADKVLWQMGRWSQGCEQLPGGRDLLPERPYGKSASRRANKGQQCGSENVAKYVWIPACFWQFTCGTAFF